jgi:hypothetical protein
MPAERRFRQRAVRPADAEGEGEERVVRGEEVAVPALACLRDRLLRETGIGVDEDLRQRLVLGPHHPAAPREVDHQVGSRADLGDFVTRLSVIAALVVHVGPGVLEADASELAADVVECVCRIGRDRVLDGVEIALARVFHVEDVVAQALEAGDVLERTPRDAADRVAPDDAGEHEPLTSQELS